MPKTLSMARMAASMGVSKQTFDVYMRKWPDMPVVSRGGPGQRYEFDPVAVRAFIRQRKRDEQEGRAALRDGPARPQSVLGLDDDDDGSMPSPTRRRLDDEKVDFVRNQNRRLERIEATARRELLPLGDVLMALAAALQHLGKANRASIKASCRELGVPDAAMRVFERNLGRDQRDFVRALPGFLDALDLDNDPDPDADAGA